MLVFLYNPDRGAEVKVTTPTRATPTTDRYSFSL
jgi:hypothetical protein